MMDAAQAAVLYMDLDCRIEELPQDAYLLSLRQYESLCSAYNDIPEYYLCKIRLAKYFWGQYYSKYGSPIRAEDAYKEALRTAAPEKTHQILPDAKIKCGLLLVYHAENNTEDLLPLLQELVRLATDEQYCWALDQKERLTIYTVGNEYYNFSWGYGYLDWVKDAVLKIHQQLLSGEKRHTAELVCFACTSALLLAETGYASDLEYRACWEILNYLHANALLNEGLERLVLRTLIRLAPELHLFAEASVDELVGLAERRKTLISSNAEIFQMAASFYFGAGRYDAGSTCLRRALDMITAEWQFDTRYFDKRAYQILEPAQLNFLGCYDTIRRYMDERFAYEKVLQFKALASLAGRERNRILHSNRIDPELMNLIRNFQDRIAWKEAEAEAEKLFRNRIAWKETETEKLFRDRSVTYENDASMLRRLEADFSRSYPSSVSFADITLEKVCGALPNESAVVEYLFCEIDYEKHEFSTSLRERKTAIDIYLLCKRNHNCTLKRWTVSNGSDILAQTREFVALLSKPESSSEDPIEWLREALYQISKPESSSEEQKEPLRKALYQKLIDPVLPYINGVRQLYIAPDRDLLNLPFELLSDERNVRLEENHDIVRIECARDLLFCGTARRPGAASLVIGNPQFTIGSSEYALPFSQSEAKIVGTYCGCQAYIGAEATKNLLLSASAKGYRNIHIAAHSYFDNRRTPEPMYSSALIFAGYGNWADPEKKDPEKMDPVYGNGVVTADEISRMDLRGVDLVVLSTCWSGMNAILEDKGFHGLLGAFSAAGARYVISHLWEADDLAATILMGYFYDYYIQKKQPPPAALNSAKHSLQNATIRQLKEKGLFRFLWRHAPDSTTKQKILKYWLMRGQVRPFADESFWGGFACYRCN